MNKYKIKQNGILKGRLGLLFPRQRIVYRTSEGGMKDIRADKLEDTQLPSGSIVIQHINGGPGMMNTVPGDYERSRATYQRRIRYGDTPAQNDTTYTNLNKLGLGVIDPKIGFNNGYYEKRGGVLKAQNGFLNTGQKAYNSKFGKGLRSFLNGADSDLTDEEYFEKHGFHKPVGNIGILGTMVAPEWDFLDGPVVAENFGLSGETPKIVNEVKSLITSGKKVRSAAEKHESFMKGLNTYTKNKYSLEFKNLKPEYKKSIELEYRDLIGKIHK